MTQEKLDAVLAAIDAANARDPALHEDDDGTPAPEALLYGRRMSAELARLFPDASPHLAIACRGQHIERWALKRADYPEGKAGYLAWRREQARRHGARVAGIMTDAGWSEADAERVAALLRKEALKRNPETQALEDVVCFVFLRWYFAPFAAKHPHDKVLDIVAKTARKMSDAARARAVKEFDLPDEFAAAVAA